jgi:hypothetical protein
MKKTLILLCFFIAQLKLQASHLSGANISYTHITGNTYQVQLELVRDCTGVSFGITESINLHSTSLGIDTTFTLSNVGLNVNAVITCPTGYTSCNSALAIIPGYQYCNYSGIIDIGATANDWIFSYSACCMGGGILNNSCAGIAAYAKLNNSIASNNGVQYHNPLNLVSGIGINNYASLTAYELDGDSLSYSIIPPIEIVNGGIITSCSYWGGTPFGTGGIISIDSITGEIKYINSALGSFLVAFKIDEYRNGTLIGSSNKELILNFIIGTNSPPELSGFNNTNNYITNYTTCGGAINFTVNSSDSNLVDSSFVEYVPNTTNATVVNNLAKNQVCTLSWTPTILDVSSEPYVFNFRVSDNACQINNENTYTFLVYVNHCNTDTVWAGDANADFIANNQDFLALGLANAATGIVRPGATTIWQPEYCANWSQSFVSGINYKHADCDGNGIVNISIDQNAIIANYGLFHNKKDVAGKKNRGFPDFYIDTAGIIFAAGSTVQLPIMMGEPTSTLTDFYGVASTIEVTNAYATNGINIDKNGTWIPTSNLEKFSHKVGNTRNEFAITKFNQTGSNGYGRIGTVSYSIAANAPIGAVTEFNLLNTKVINKNGDTIAVDIPEAYGIISNATGMESFVFKNIEIAPNPASSFVKIQSNNATDYNITVRNTVGEILLQTNCVGSKTIDVANFARGVYFVQLQDDQGNSETRKVVLK